LKKRVFNICTKLGIVKERFFPVECTEAVGFLKISGALNTSSGDISVTLLPSLLEILLTQEPGLLTIEYAIPVHLREAGVLLFKSRGHAGQEFVEFVPISILSRWWWRSAK